MQSTHRLSVTDEIRFVAVLHALSEIELKLMFFSLNVPHPERKLLPCCSKEEYNCSGSGPCWIHYRVSMLCARVQLDRWYNREVTAIEFKVYEVTSFAKLPHVTLHLTFPSCTSILFVAA